MSALDKAVTHNQFSNDLQLVQIEYDFAVDGGSVGALDALTASEALVVHMAWMKVKTTCVGATATVSLGKSGDAAGLIPATAVASLVAGAVIDQTAFGSAYKLAAADVVQMAIATAALTAGKIVLCMVVSKF